MRRRLAALGVEPGDVEERFVRGTGPGGQKINKTASTIWLRHRPTGVGGALPGGAFAGGEPCRAWARLCAKLEERRRAAAAQLRDEQERIRRRSRQKSRGQKIRMIEAKKHRADVKVRRGRVGDE